MGGAGLQPGADPLPPRRRKPRREWEQGHSREELRGRCELRPEPLALRATANVVVDRLAQLGGERRDIGRYEPRQLWTVAAAPCHEEVADRRAEGFARAVDVDGRM